MSREHDKPVVSKRSMKSPVGDILVVDDEIHNLQLLTQLLSEEGYQIRPAEKPLLAIEAALAQPPCLILLDVRMPEMDGFEVCKRLKQDERTRDIPIIFISALQDVQDRILGFEAGGADFITKPYQEDEVLARVRTHMSLHHAQSHMAELVAERTADLEAEIVLHSQTAAEKERLREFELLVATTASEFVHIPHELVDTKIDKTLERISKALDADLSTLLIWNEPDEPP